MGVTFIDKGICRGAGLCIRCYSGEGRSSVRARQLSKAVSAIESNAFGRYILPWLEFHVEETKSALCRDGGNRWWQDGLTEQNRRTLDKFLEYSHKQGLSKRRWKVEDLFAKSSIEAFVL